MFKKIITKLDCIIDYVTGISVSLSKLVCETDAIREEVKDLKSQIHDLEETVSLLRDVRVGSEMEQGIESIMNYGRKVKKNA